MMEPDPTEIQVEFNPHGLLNVNDPELLEEFKKWDELEVNHQQVIAINVIALDNWLKTLTEMLVEADIIDAEEFVQRRDNRYFRYLKFLRERITPQIREAKLKARGIELPNMIIPKNDRKH